MLIYRRTIRNSCGNIQSKKQFVLAKLKRMNPEKCVAVLFFLCFTKSIDALCHRNLNERQMLSVEYTWVKKLNWLTSAGMSPTTTTEWWWCSSSMSCGATTTEPTGVCVISRIKILISERSKKIQRSIFHLIFFTFDYGHRINNPQEHQELHPWRNFQFHLVVRHWVERCYNLNERMNWMLNLWLKIVALPAPSYV